MVRDVPQPDLDLSRMYRLDERVPRAVLDVLAMGLPDVGDLENGYISGFADDDDPDRSSTFSYGPAHAREVLPVRKARDAWRLAAERGLVPAAWPDDPRRCFPDQDVLFFCHECDGMGATGWNYDDLCGACDGRGNTMKRGSVALPTTAHEIAWMLAFPEIVERAEALAREAVRRLGEANPRSRVDRVQWGRVRSGKPVGTIPVLIASPIWDHVRRPDDWDWEAMKGPAFTTAPWYPDARKFDALTRQVLCYDVGMAWVHRAEGVEGSPFEPLLRLWELGVMMEELDDEKIVLERARHRYIRSWRSGVPLG
jgi:hypothetical protein